MKTHNVKQQSIITNESKNKTITIITYGKKNVSPKNILVDHHDLENSTINCIPNKGDSKNILSPQLRLLSPQRRLLSPQNRLLSPQNRLLSPQNRLLSPQSRIKSLDPNISIVSTKILNKPPRAPINEQKTESLTSISSKLIILEKFLKNYELCLLNMYNVKYGALVNFDGFSKILNILGFVKNDCSSQVHKNVEEKIDTMQTNLYTFTKMQIKTKNQNNNADKEHETVKECWAFINRENLERIDSNQILIFLSSILGLYDGEEKNEEPNVNKDKNLINHQFLKKLIPEINFENYSYQKSVVKQLKIFYRELYENRMNLIMDAKKKNYAEKKSHENKDLVFKPKISKNSMIGADNFRKKCLNVII